MDSHSWSPRCTASMNRVSPVIENGLPKQPEKPSALLQVAHSIPWHEMTTQHHTASCHITRSTFRHVLPLTTADNGSHAPTQRAQARLSLPRAAYRRLLNPPKLLLCIGINVTRHRHDGVRRQLILHLPHHVQSRLARHADVQQHQVGVPATCNELRRLQTWCSTNSPPQQQPRSRHHRLL